MKTFLISYDLNGDGNREVLSKAIKDYGIWAQITNSLWAVQTESSVLDVREKLNKLLPEGSRLMVVKSGAESAWRNVMCQNDWLQANL